MSNTDLSTLTEAKNIYTHNLCKILQPQIYKGFISILNLCKGTNETLKNFQRKLEGIPKWNSMIIDDEYNRIIQETKCDYLDNLLNAVFIANSKILSVINNDKRTIDITVPNPKKFLHACYIACAYNFFMEPFLFDDSREDYRKKQKNMKEIFDIINKCIVETVENLLPIEDLLRNCLNNQEEEVEVEVEENDNKNFDDLKEDFAISEFDSENKSPNLDILEGKNLYDAHKNYSEYKEEPGELIDNDEEKETSGHLLVSEEQMKKLDQEKIEEPQSESDNEEEDLSIKIKQPEQNYYKNPENPENSENSENSEKNYKKDSENQSDEEQSETGESKETIESKPENNKPKKVYFFDDI